MSRINVKQIRRGQLLTFFRTTCVKIVQFYSIIGYYKYNAHGRLLRSMQLLARTHTSTAAALQRRSVTKGFNRALELSRLLVEWANALDVWPTFLSVAVRIYRRPNEKLLHFRH